MKQSNSVRCFLTVARLKSFSAAAKELYMSRQAVSKQVKYLEEELGTKLFIRTTKHIDITPAGELFAAYYLEQAERFDAVCRRAAELSLKDNSIRIGYLYGLEINNALYEVTGAFRRRYPNISLQWKRGNPLDLVQDVQSHSLDIAITFTDTQTRAGNNLKVLPIGSIHMVVAVSRDNPKVLNARSALDFQDETFYAWTKKMTEQETERENIIRHGRDLGINISHVSLLDSREAVYTAVDMGEGAALCTELDSICFSPRIATFALKEKNELGCVLLENPGIIIHDFADLLTTMQLQS